MISCSRVSVKIGGGKSNVSESGKISVLPSKSGKYIERVGDKLFWVVDPRINFKESGSISKILKNKALYSSIYGNSTMDEVIERNAIKQYSIGGEMDLQFFPLAGALFFDSGMNEVFPSKIDLLTGKVEIPEGVYKVLLLPLRVIETKKIKDVKTNYRKVGEIN